MTPYLQSQTLFQKLPSSFPATKPLMLNKQQNYMLLTYYHTTDYLHASFLIKTPIFTSVFSRELCRTLGIAQNISTPYHPQTDGQSERTNQQLEQYLRIFINYHQQNWASLLPLAQYMLNAWPNATTKKAPFKLIMGHIPQVHWATWSFKSPTLETRLQQMKQAWQDTKEALRKAADLEVPTCFKPYQPGDKVWLEGHNLTTTHPTAKLAPRHYGPFPITHVVSCTSYQLKLPPQWKIHNVFHTTLLTQYKETSLNGNQNQEPAPELINSQLEWEVEQILCVRRYWHQVQYLVRWKGFSEAHDSWEPATNVHTEELVKEFYKRHPKAIQHTTTHPTPVIICSITMSSPVPSASLPLAERIDSAPLPLTLAEWLERIPPISWSLSLSLEYPLRQLTPEIITYPLTRHQDKSPQCLLMNPLIANMNNAWLINQKGSSCIIAASKTTPSMARNSPSKMELRVTPITSDSTMTMLITITMCMPAATTWMASPMDGHLLLLLSWDPIHLH